jgi:hypothetical protein
MAATHCPQLSGNVAEMTKMTGSSGSARLRGWKVYARQALPMGIADRLAEHRDVVRAFLESVAKKPGAGKS